MYRQKISKAFLRKSRASLRVSRAFLRMKHYLIILILAAIALFVHGYQFGVSDQHIFIPYILKAADPALFPNDILFSQPSASASLFYPIMGHLSLYFDLQLIFLIGFLIFQYLFFIGIYKIAIKLLKNSYLAYLSLLPFVLPKFIGGTATFTFDTFFGYRSIGLIFFIFFLGFLLERKYYLAVIVAAVGIWIHPLSFIPNLLLLPASVLIFSKNKIKHITQSLILFSVLLFPFLVVSNTSLLSLLPNINDQIWLEVIRFRDDYIFPALWNPRGWLALIMYLSLTLILMRHLNNYYQKNIKVIIIASLMILAFAALMLDIFRLPALAQFQLARSISPISYLALILSPLLLVYKNTILKILGSISFIALVLNLFNLLAVSLSLFVLFKFIRKDFNARVQNIKTFTPLCLFILLIFVIYFGINIQNNNIEYPKKDSDWINIQKWAKSNLNQKDVFLVPWNQTGFRIFSNRSIVGDIKDGAVVMYSPSYAVEWSNIRNDISEYDSLTFKEFVHLKTRYNFNYFITRTDQNIGIQPIYSNSSYKLFIL